jgi:hypothetical protein
MEMVTRRCLDTPLIILLIRECYYLQEISLLLLFTGYISAVPRLTALLPPRSYGKPEAAAAVVVAPDDGQACAQNMLSCI